MFPCMTTSGRLLPSKPRPEGGPQAFPFPFLYVFLYPYLYIAERTWARIRFSHHGCPHPSLPPSRRARVILNDPVLSRSYHIDHTHL